MMPETRQIGGDLPVIVEESRRLANDSAHATWSSLHLLAATIPLSRELVVALGADPVALEARLSQELFDLKPVSGPLAPLAGSRPAPEVDAVITAVQAMAREEHARNVSAGRILLILSQRDDAAGELLREAN